MSASSDSVVADHLSYRAFRGLFLAAWGFVAAGVLSAAARFRAGFVFFVSAGLILIFLGGTLALNVGRVSDRMVQGVVSRWPRERPLSMTRVGGLVMLVIGLGVVTMGFLDALR